ncbi:GDSL-type esterase/lipase family protein [Nocardioides sp. cx-173]|uniref:GDSL-type esterase/lipase family protein n=1 Tax=Nocardioides sp. cx-173 TaxID=2898796 RepID=UPI001E3B8FD2|nr:GDSL-type esterase/lipase family protein [Nocardioides sp. cx-173]MCD4523828.1 GDSL-type esterase/lipase family protein [Nocardioides sp. cx-173]UGB41851.1 GDSL-type esterase/lipase family protein [Nocardioides sp. cx-173]
MWPALNFRACAGAKIADVTSAQLSALSGTTRYVTISVGGNDAGFTGVLTECATPWWAGDCNGAIDGVQAFIKNTLPGRLSTLYSAIRSRAAGAKVVVVGYPRIFMGEDCNAATWFSPAEESRLNQTAESYHPNRLGHSSGYAPLIGPLLAGAPARTATTYGARVPAAKIAASQRRHRAVDARIEPEVFRRLDLTTPAARAAARRAGIDLERWLARH